MKLKLGERIQAQIEDLIVNNELIVSVQGQLVRVRNSSHVKPKKGMLLDLVVVKQNPLELQLYSDYKKGFERYV